MIKRFFNNRAQLRKVLENTGLLLSDRLLRYAIGFLIGAAIARYLGPEQFGLMSFVFSLVAILVPMIGNGLDNIVIRELVRSPSTAYETLGTVALVRGLGAACATVVAVVASTVLRPSDSHVVTLVALMASAMFPLAADVLELWFQSRLQSRYPIYGKGIAFLSVSAWKVYMIFTNAPVFDIILAGLAENVIGAFGLVYFFRQQGMHLSKLRARVDLLRRLLREGWAIVLSGVAGIVSIRVDQLLIAGMLGDSSVGVYSAAFRISEFAYAIPSLIAVSVLPVLVDSKKIDDVLFKQRIALFLRLMVLASVGLSIIVVATSGTLIPLFFGQAYRESASILQLQIWSCVFVFMTVASNQYLIVEQKTILCLYRTLYSAVFSLGLNALLIPAYGLRGAAIAGLIANAVGVFAIGLHKDVADHFRDLVSSLRLLQSLKVCWAQLQHARRSA